MRVLLIVNPTASSMTARRRVEIQRALGDRHRLEVAETVRRGHAARLAREAAREGVEAVVVLAGDGTLNEAADGLAGSTTALAPLPGGSTNVFARSVGYRADLDGATRQVVAALERRSFRRVGLGIANGRRFLFHLGAGFDARVIEQVERHSWLKRRAAHPSFVVATVGTFLSGFDRVRPLLRAELPDGTPLADGFFAIVSNSSPYTFFGSRPLVVAREAALDRPLTLTMFRRLDLGVLLPAAVSAYLHTRRIARDPRILQSVGLEGLTLVATRAPFPWQVDGDFLGYVERLELRWEPDTLTLVVP